MKQKEEISPKEELAAFSKHKKELLAAYKQYEEDLEYAMDDFEESLIRGKRKKLALQIKELSAKIAQLASDESSL